MVIDSSISLRYFILFIYLLRRCGVFYNTWKINRKTALQQREGNDSRN